MNSSERRSALSLALLFAMRMLGLFMIIPILTLYAQHLKGYSPLWAGIAIGAYGLTQALLQLPMGWLSDRIGRKPVITIGLLLFAAGSVIASIADSIYLVALGRALQGTGAIASTILALASDLTRHEHRPKVMGIIGMSIGIAFAVALVAGPLLAPHIGLSGLFELTAILALLGIGLLHLKVPTPTHHYNSEHQLSLPLLRRLLGNTELLRLNCGIFILHLLLTSLFVALPLELQKSGIADNQHWHLYLPALLGSFILMVPLLIMASRLKSQRLFFLSAIILLAISLLLFDSASGVALYFGALLLFFTAFNYLEASLPALIAMNAPAGNKGSAMGIYSSFQFFGAFIGGLTGGIWLNYFSAQELFLLILVIALVWLMVAFRMKERSNIGSVSLEIPNLNAQQAAQLLGRLNQLQGVEEAVIIRAEQTAYLKVDRSEFDIRQALALTGGGEQQEC